MRALNPPNRSNGIAFAKRIYTETVIVVLKESLHTIRVLNYKHFTFF